MSLWKGRYSKLPHGFWTADQVLEVGERAATFLLKMSDFADRNETDGCLSDRQTATLGAPKGRRAALRRLADGHLIVRDGDQTGWEIVGWLDGHRSASEWAEYRETRRSAGRKGGQAKAENHGRASPNTKQDAKHRASSVLKPGHVMTSQDMTGQPPPLPPSEPEQPTDELRAAVAVADGLMRNAGYVDEPAGADMVNYVAKAQRRGWPAEHLADSATEVGAMPPDEVETTPRRVLLGILRKRANEDAPADLFKKPSTEPTVDLDFGDVHAEYAERTGMET